MEKASSDIGPAAQPDPPKANLGTSLLGLGLLSILLFVVIAGLVVVGWVNSLQGHNL